MSGSVRRSPFSPRWNICFRCVLGQLYVMYSGSSMVLCRYKLCYPFSGYSGTTSATDFNERRRLQKTHSSEEATSCSAISSLQSDSGRPTQSGWVGVFDLVIVSFVRLQQCDHNLCKGEYNPSSIKFKIQLFALLHVPEVRILHVPELLADKVNTQGHQSVYNEKL